MYPSEYLSYGLGTSADIVTKPTGVKTFKLSDHLGSTRTEIAEGGATASWDYEPYGDPVAGTAPRKGFIDREKDGENGLGDFGVRKYDSETGRFLSGDPLWEEYRGWTPYQYAVNSPLSVSDPSGLKVQVIAGKYSSATLATTKMTTAEYVVWINQVLAGMQSMTDDELTYDASGIISIKTRKADTDITKPIGTDYVRTMIEHSQTVRIYQGDGSTPNQTTPDSDVDASNPTRGGGGFVVWNPQNTKGGLDVNGSDQRPAFIGLAHELMGHMRAIFAGLVDHTLLPLLTDPDSKVTGLIDQDELDSRRVENDLRREAGLDERQMPY